MPGLESAGRLLLLLGLFIALVGLILLFAGRVPFLGRLPGDIYFQKGSFSFAFPLASSILLSLLLTFLLNLVFRFFR